MKNNNRNDTIAAVINAIGAKVLGITSSPSTTLEIKLDIVEVSKTSRALGQMIFVWQEEDGRNILSLGQIVEVRTENRWHEDSSFKGVIKRHGALPHLSGAADNRLADVSVQSSFDVNGQEPIHHILGVSPSTGHKIYKMNDDVMRELVRHNRSAITYIGCVYGTDVNLPMWFKHFGEDKEIPDLGAKDAYHIGIFGKTGSGKSVTAAMFLSAYAKNHEHMNIFVLDPQEQFSNDRDLLPGGGKLRTAIERAGMKYDQYNLVGEVSLPAADLNLFGDLLVNYGFIQDAFGPFYSDDKIELMRECVVSYLDGKRHNPKFRLDADDVLPSMIDRFLEKPEEYIKKVYGTPSTRERLQNTIIRLRRDMEGGLTTDPRVDKWRYVAGLFSPKKKISVDDLVKKAFATPAGNFIVLNLAFRAGEADNENLQALFLRLIEKGIVKRGGEIYAKGGRANCLIVMDEAHRFVSRHSPDVRVRELTKEIVDSVRTTRKYGIGHMFITQSLESMDDEILKQMRIYAFGYGLTMGSEIRKMKEIINSPASVKLYQSFIDPSSSRRFPFMFFGPVSPLSATGAPLFVEVYTDYADYKKMNPIRNAPENAD